MARFHLRLSEAEFMALTPRQLHLLIARHREQSEYEEYLAALVCATTANFSMGAPKRALLPADFMASKPNKSAARSGNKISRQAIANNIRCFLRGQIQAQQTK